LRGGREQAESAGPVDRLQAAVGAELVSAHLNIPEETLAKFPRCAQGIVPLS
jgi:hypothetical protein